MARAEKPFEIIEHTADVGVIVHGSNLEELFVNAANALFSFMVELSDVDERDKREISATAKDWEGLMVNWLSELLYYVDAEELLFRRFQIQKIEPFHLQAQAFGEVIDRERHRLHYGVKAITKHMLQVQEENGRWRAKILFDI